MNGNEAVRATPTPNKKPVLILAITQEEDGFEYVVKTAPDMPAKDAAEALFAVTLDVNASADAGVPHIDRSGRMPTAKASEETGSTDESPCQELDLADLRRRCDEIHFQICGFCGSTANDAPIGIGERAFLRAARDAASALVDLVSDVDELCMYASRIKTFAGLALDAGSAEHDIPELEAIAVRLLNDFREEAGLPTRTTGDASNLAWQIARDVPETA